MATLTLPVPATGPAESRGVRSSDVGGTLLRWEVSLNMSTGRYSGSYKMFVILSVGEPEDGRVAITSARVCPDGDTYRMTEGGHRSKTYPIADGTPVPKCDKFDTIVVDLYRVMPPL